MIRPSIIEQKTAQHTPGPWKVTKIRTRCGGPRIDNATGNLAVADLWDSGDSTDSNATLISAAPDILEALKDVKEDLLKLAAFLMTTRRKDLQDIAKNAWQKATVAIAKAELGVRP